MKLSNEVKTGILITLTLAAFIWGLNYLKGKDVFTSRNRYFAVYSNVDGLVSSNPVFMNGYRIGIVNDIAFSPDKSGKLIVTLLIDKNVFVARNSVAKIFSSDLIGTKALRIDLGDSKESLSDNDTLKAELEYSFAQQVGKEMGPIKDKTERLIETIDSLAVLMRQFLDSDTRSSLHRSIDHLESTMASADRLMGDERGKLLTMLGNMESITANLKNSNEEISHTLQNFSQISDTIAAVHFAEIIHTTQKTMEEANLAFSKINKGQGTIGQLVQNDSLYRNLENSSKNLDKLLIDLKEHPGRYIHFSVFGKKNK